MSTPSGTDSRRGRNRVSAACDACKARKVKCDGLLPCAYCKKRRREHHCKYTPPKQRFIPPLTSPYSAAQSIAAPGSDAERTEAIVAAAVTGYRTSGVGVTSGDGVEESAIVPREARLLCDAQGKLIFIGDCAPLSFLQTVRHLITTRIDPNGFATKAPRDPIIEHMSPGSSTLSEAERPMIDPSLVPPAVSSFMISTSGLIDVLNTEDMWEGMHAWCKHPSKCDDGSSAVYYLVLAIGLQVTQEDRAERYFKHARQLALLGLGGQLGILTVQAFILVAVYMTSTCQTNGAFLYLALAVRTAYAIGLHRTEVNAHFGKVTHRLRDQIWKSLRVIDLYLACSLGRPPATSDVDCSVPYDSAASDDNEPDVLSASVQAFLILERVVVEIYSRKQISIRLAEEISAQLRGWAVKWLAKLTRLTSETVSGNLEPSRELTVGAAQVLSTYFYAVMLLTRPFLVYYLHEHLANGQAITKTDAHSKPRASAGRAKFAHATVDAAILLVELVDGLMKRGMLTSRMPLVVSWLFTASLVLGLAVLGEDGRTYERHARTSITCLDFFAKNDQHAMQYSLICDALLKTTCTFISKREDEDRHRRTQTSSQLFGLLPTTSQIANSSTSPTDHARGTSATFSPSATPMGGDNDLGIEGILPSPDWSQFDSELMALPSAMDSFGTFGGDGHISGESGQDSILRGLPLFPMFDTSDELDFLGL